MEETVSTEIRERGEITIPKKLRQALHLEAGQALTCIPLGSEGFLVTPKQLPLEEARYQIRKILSQTRAKAKDVLAGLEDSREETFQKFYGSKHARKKD